MEPKVIACVGDSITFGYGLIDPKNYSYPSRLKELLGDNYEVHNFGISGATMFRHDGFSYMDSQKYRDSLKLNPDIVIIMLGTNDSVYIRNLGLSPNTFEQLTDQMIRSYLNLSSKPKVFIASPPHAYKGRTDVEDYVRAYIQPIIKKVAERFPEVTYINMWDHTANMSNLFPDGIHPNEEGYLSIANTMLSYIKSYLNIK
ncbi:MAG: hypothetical protein E7623_05055 [Ruminococcaceae bacterium]|nr:hypothetical protein [Oscillospiraceae bacterium]